MANGKGKGKENGKMPIQPGDGMVKDMPGPMHGMTKEQMPSPEEMSKMGRGGMGSGMGGKGKK